MSENLKLGSLFSGYGGLDQAVHAAFGDVATAWVSDFDVGPNKILGRPAPEPTEPNGKNSPRLSARFAEWMMGLPDGWVTDVPNITRSEALRALGNGVVPQQGEVALAHLLNIWKETRNVATQDQ